MSDDPPLGDVLERARIVRLVVVDGVDGDANVNAGRVGGSVHDDAAGEDLAWQDSADAGGHAQRLVDARAQILAFGQLGTAADLLDVVEARSDLRLQLLQAGLVVEEIEDGAGDDGGGGIGPWFFFFFLERTCQ